jgi:hypothetical protein
VIGAQYEHYDYSAYPLMPDTREESVKVPNDVLGHPSQAIDFNGKGGTRTRREDDENQ